MDVPVAKRVKLTEASGDENSTLASVEEIQAESPNDYNEECALFRNINSKLSLAVGLKGPCTEPSASS